MQITRNFLNTNPGPSDWFTGSVFVDTVAAPSEGSQVGAASVHFTPGARAAWHTHPHAQTTRFMTQIAMQQADDSGHVVEWGRHVSDDECTQAPSLEAGDR
jgi:hypothetical protein